MNTIASSGSDPRNPAETRTFTAPWGRALRWISIGASAFCLFASLDGIFLHHWISFPAYATVIQVSLPLIIVFTTLPFTIRGYHITPSSLEIERLGWRTRLPLRDLTGAEIVPSAMKSSLRTCGNGGLFSFTGWYWNRTLGHYRAFVTDLKRTVVLRFGKRTIVLSPDQPEQFLAALREVSGKVIPP
jgi:hypothetical protein